MTVYTYNVSGTPPTIKHTLPTMLHDYAYFLDITWLYAPRKPSNMTNVTDLNTDGWVCEFKFIPDNAVGSNVVHRSDDTPTTAVAVDSLGSPNHVEITLTGTQTASGIFADTSYTLQLLLIKSSQTYLFFLGSLSVQDFAATATIDSTPDNFLIQPDEVNVTVEKGATFVLPMSNFALDWGLVTGETEFIKYEIFAVIGDVSATGKGGIGKEKDNLQFSIGSKLTNSLPVGTGYYEVSLEGGFDPNDFSGTAVYLYMDYFPIMYGKLTILPTEDQSLYIISEPPFII